MLCPSLVAEFCRRLVDAVESWNMSGNRGKRKIAVSIITVNDDDGSVYDELAEVRKKLPSSNIDDYLTREYLGIGMSAPGPLFPEVLAPVSEQNIGPPEYGTHRVVTFYVEHRSPSEQSALVTGLAGNQDDGEILSTAILRFVDVASIDQSGAVEPRSPAGAFPEQRIRAVTGMRSTVTLPRLIRHFADAPDAPRQAAIATQNSRIFSSPLSLRMPRALL